MRMKWIRWGRGRKPSQEAEITPILSSETFAGASYRLFGRVLQEPSDEAQVKELAQELADAHPDLLRTLYEQVLICQEMADATFREALELKGKILGLRDLHREAKRIAAGATEKIVPFPEHEGEDSEEEDLPPR